MGSVKFLTSSYSEFEVVETNRGTLALYRCALTEQEPSFFVEADEVTPPVVGERVYGVSVQGEPFATSRVVEVIYDQDA